MLIAKDMVPVLGCEQHSHWSNDVETQTDIHLLDKDLRKLKYRLCVLDYYKQHVPPSIQLLCLYE